MTWTLQLALTLLLSAWCCSIVSSLQTQTDRNDGESATKYVKKNALPNKSLASNSKGPTIHTDDRPQVVQMKMQEIRPRASVIKQTNSLKYSNLEDKKQTVNLLSHSGDVVSERKLNNSYSPEMKAFDGSVLSRNDHILYADDENRDSTDKNKDDFDDELEQNISFSVWKRKVDEFKSHGDIFPCSECYCSHTAGRFIIANCTDQKLTAFPVHLPKKTMSIYLSNNRLHTLTTTSFLHYPYLLNVSVTSNRNLTAILNDSSWNHTSGLRHFNLSYCAIRTIEDTSFAVMPELTDLIIGNNKLQYLTRSTFKGLHNLKHLDLSKNDIRKIELGTFDVLHNLRTLDLSQNKRLGYSVKTFPPQLFTNLKHLRKLSIQFNSDKGEKSYPNKALQYLIELQELSIDGLGGLIEFGPEMKSLKNLTHLKLKGNCWMRNITETFFDNIPYLRSFLVDHCHLAYVHPVAYSKLEYLRDLKLANLRHYDIDRAFQDLACLNNSKLNSLAFNRLRRPVHQCKFLSNEHSKYIKNIELEHLDLSANRIALLGNDFIADLPQTLKKLVLKRNKLTSETQSIKQLAIMKELTELDVSLQNANEYFQSYSSTPGHPKSKCPDKLYPDNSEELEISQETQEHYRLTCNNYDNSDGESQFDSLAFDDTTIKTKNDRPSLKMPKRRYIDIPPKLKTLKASRFQAFGMQILTHKLVKPNSLSVIDFSKSFMSVWGSGILPPGIVKANLADNYCTRIGPGFFTPNNSHSHIVLNNNFLGPDFANDNSGLIFASLKNTKYLDISTNLIYRLPRRFFKGLSSLRYLKISDNRLSSLNTSFAHMRNLQFLDLSRNSIRWIDPETMNDLDSIAALPGHRLEMDLTMNPLPCTCAGLDVITWMATTKVHFYNQHLLMCDFDNMISEPVGDLEKRRESLQRLCVAKSAIIIGCVAAIIVVMVIFGFGLMYRYRWKLRYLHNNAMAALFGFKPDDVPRPGCTFDAYFVYTAETRDFVLKTCIQELEQKRGHRLCVEDRDFLLGTYLVSNIVSAVRNSTKTVPVLTPDFYEGLYSEYSFQMAVMEELHKQRSVLHLLLYKPIPNDQMSHEELNVMKRNSYTEYPPEEEADDNIMQNFWDALSQAIGHTGVANCQLVLDMPRGN